MSNDPEKTVWGISPLGGNAAEGSATGEIQGVPLFWDDRVSNYISEQAIEELDDRDLSLALAEDFNNQEKFRQRAGYTKDGTRS
ncbi:MAG: hypothetical protein U9O94_01470 [Nanoarchaeota archaeon]|nr:hypothetical protein [Nanoarchaeota archaeon]